MTLITPEQHRQFEQQGFFILENFFSPIEMDTLAEEIEVYTQRQREHLQAQGGTEGISRADEIQFTTHLAEQDDAIRQFATQEKMARVATELIGPDVRLYWNQSVFKHPETPRDFPWHQDNGYTPVDPEQYLTCWLALTDATLENGCIWVLPRTHLNGTLPHEESPLGKLGYFGSDTGTPVPVAKGSMIVFSSLLLHKSGPNLTHDQVRKAYILQYCTGDAMLRSTGEPLTDRMWVAQNGVKV